MAYIPLQPGQAATQGTSGQAVADLQTKLNATNAGKPGWVPLKVDSMYGPVTQAAVNFKPVNPIISTGSQVAAEYAKNSQDLNQMIQTKTGTPAPVPTNQGTMTDAPNADGTAAATPDIATFSDPYTQMLDRIGATSDKATQNLISTIKTAKQNREATVNNEYDRLKAGLFSLGLSTEKLNFTPDLVYGGIMQAENARMAKLQELDQTEATALLEAQQASENKDFALLKEKMAHLKDIKNEKLDVLKSAFDKMNYEAKIGELQAGMIYDELQGMDESKKLDFMKTVADSYGIPLNALTSQVAAIRDKKSKPSGTSGGYTSQELRKLRAAHINPDNISESDNYLYNGIAPSDSKNDTSLSREDMEAEYGKSKLYKLAIKMGVPKTKNLSKNNEIDQLFANQKYVQYIRDMTGKGYSIDEIISSQ